MPEQLALPRYTSENTGSSLKITIPSKKNWFIIIFLGFWLTIWAVAEVGVVGGMILGVIQMLIEGKFLELLIEGLIGGLFMLVWLALWTAGGGFALYTWFWNITGKEVIEVTDESIQISHRIFSFGKPKEYTISHIKDLRTVPTTGHGLWGFRVTRFAWGVPPGTLSFDYGAKTINFGSGCEEAEAKMILKEIWQAYPQYKPQEET
jgi:hypothetical protein